MIGLPFPFPIAIVETRYDLSFVWFAMQIEEASLEVFHEGAFPAARLSFDKKEVRVVCRSPRKITLMCPEPL